jgi:hypothetical protein
MKLHLAIAIALLTLSTASCDRSPEKVTGVANGTSEADADARIVAGEETFQGRGSNGGQESQVSFVADRGKVVYAVWSNFIPAAGSSGRGGVSYHGRAVTKNGKEFAWQSNGTDELTIEGKRLDLGQGRLILLSGDGDVQQVDVDLADAPVRSEDGRKPFWEALRKENPRIAKFLGD